MPQPPDTVAGEMARREDDLAPLYLEADKRRRGAAALEEMRQRVDSRRRLGPAPESSGRSAQPAPTTGELLGGVARGVAETPTQVFGGVLDAVREAEKAAIGISLDIGEAGLGHPVGERAPSGERQFEGPQIKQPASELGGLVRSTSTFLAGFAGAGKVLKPIEVLARAPKAGQAAVKGALADFAVWDEHERRLSDLIQEQPALANPVNEFLASDPSDSTAEGRFKSAAEGLGLGVATEGLLSGLKAIRAQRTARRLAGHPLPGAPAPTMTKQELERLGDPNAPLLRTVEKAAKGVTGVTEKAAGATAKLAPGSIIGETAEGGDIYINWARINAPEDVQKVMDTMASAYSEDVDKARRGVRTHGQTKAAARRLDAFNELMARGPKGALNAEQTYAARQLWVASASKLEELAQAAVQAPTDANLFAFRKQAATHYAIQNEVLGARAETARALNQWNIPAGWSRDVDRARAIEKLLDDNGGGKVTQEFAQRVAALAESGNYDVMEQFVRRSVYARSRDALVEGWIMALLSNPKTHAVNVLSNTAVVFQQLAESAVAARVSRVAGTEEGVVLGEATAQLFGMIEGFKDAFTFAAKSARTGETGFGLGKIDLPRGNNVSAEALGIAQDSFAGRAMDGLGNLVRLPGKMLAAEDELFKTFGYRAELAARSLRRATHELNAGQIKQEDFKARVAELRENPPDDLHVAAVDAALYRTFSQTPGDFGQSIQKLVNRFPNLRFVLPFVRTPANIMHYAFERTPLAPFMSSVQADIRAGGARADLAMTRMAMGTAVMMVAADYALDGKITGAGPIDPDQRAQLRREGWQPYSIKIGDRYYSYNRLDPMGMVLGLAADTVEITANSDWDSLEELGADKVLAAGTAAIASNVMSKTYLSGISGLMEVMSDPKADADRFVQKFAGSFVPAGVAEVARQVDPTMRYVADSVDAMRVRTPGLSKGLPPRRDLWGRPINYQSGIGWAYDAFSPVYSSQYDPEPVDAELDRLGATIKTPQKVQSFGGVTVNLRKYPAVYSRFVQLAGNELRDPAWGLGCMDFLNAVVEGRHPMSQVYKLYSDGDRGGKATWLAEQVRHYRARARDQLLTEFPELRAEVTQKQNEKLWQSIPGG